MAESTAGRQPTRIETGSPIKDLGKRYLEVRHMARAIPGGDRGDAFKKQEKELYQGLVGVTAAEILAATEANRAGVLSLGRRAFEQSDPDDRPTPAIETIGFLEAVALETARLSKPDPLTQE